MHQKNPTNNENLHQQSLAIWQKFCQDLEATGKQILEHKLAQDPLDYAEGLRYITRLLRNGLEFQVENQNKQQPFFTSYAHETIKMGADNPDIRYFNCLIDPALDYVIYGNRGSVNQLLIGSYGGGYGNDGQLLLHDSLHSDVLVQHDTKNKDIASERIEISVGQSKRSDCHLFLQADSGMLIVRQMFLDRDKEQLADLKIKIITPPTTFEPLSLEQIESGLANCNQSMQGTANTFSRWVENLAPKANTLPAADQDYCQRLGGDPKIFYYHGYWQLQAHQALIIYLPKIPQCSHWNMQINNIWMESLDYRFFKIHYNKHTAHYQDDGSVIMVLAHQQPDASIYKNHLQTSGHLQGSYSFRWIQAQEIVQPQTAVINFSDLSTQPLDAIVAQIQ